jgi:hypothetical protein
VRKLVGNFEAFFKSTGEALFMRRDLFPEDNFHFQLRPHSPRGRLRFFLRPQHENSISTAKH